MATKARVCDGVSTLFWKRLFRQSDNTDKLYSSKPPPPHSSGRPLVNNIWAATHHRNERGEHSLSASLSILSERCLFPAFIDLVRCVVFPNSSASVGGYGSRCEHRTCLGSVIGKRAGAVGERHSGVKSEDIDPSLFPSSISFPPGCLIATLTNLQKWPNVSPSASANLITPHLRDGALSRLLAVTSATTTSKSSLLRPSAVTAAPSSTGCVFKC